MVAEDDPRPAAQYSAVASDGQNDMQAREAAMLLAVAEGHINHEEDADALTAAQDALAFFRSSKDHAGVADALRVVIQCYVSQGRIEEATSLAREELDAFKNAGKQSEEAKMLLSLSEICAKESKRHREALDFANQALVLLRNECNEKMEARVWLNIARIYTIQKSNKESEDPLRKAEQAANDALAIFQRGSDWKGQAEALQLAAEAKAAGGDIDGAIETAEDALDALQELDAPSELKSQKLEAFMLHSIAAMCLANGRPFKALYFAEDALEIIRRVGASKRKEVMALGTVVKALIAKNRTERAVKVARAGLKRFQDAGDSRSEADTHRILYSAYGANGNTEQALLTMDKALEASQDLGDRNIETQLLCEASDLSLKAGFLDRAVETATKALDIAKDEKHWDAANKALQHLVSALVDQEEAKEAVDVAKDLRDILESSEDAKAEASCCLILSQAHCATGTFDLAAAAAKAASEIAYKEEDEFIEASALDQLTMVYMESGKFEKAAHAAENARRIWKDQDDLPRECNALDQASKAFVQQAYKKQAGNKSASAVAGVFEKATKSANDCMEVAKGLPAFENGNGFMGNASCTLSQIHAALGESEEAFSTAKVASDFFAKAGDEKSGGFASVLMAQAQVQQEQWDKAMKNASAAQKSFKRYKNETGLTFAQTIIAKIEELMPKPEPVAQAGLEGGGAAWKMPGAKQQSQQIIGGGGGPRVPTTLNVTALDTSLVSEDVIMAKIREVALAIIGDDAEEVEEDTPLMEAGLTSSSAVMMRDEILAAIPGTKLAPTAMFDFPSVAALTEVIMEQLGK